PNRIGTGPMHTSLEAHARAFPQLAAYFRAPAEGRLGLMVTGGCAPRLVGCLAPLAGGPSWPGATPWPRPLAPARREPGRPRAAHLPREAGYDGVEVMGSEGYLINQFLSARTSRRKDAWGGSAERRMRFAVEIVRRIREAVGPDFILIYRLSMLELVENGSGW